MTFDGGAVVVSRPESFTIKGALLPMTLLELRTSDAEKIKRELTQKVANAPDFFGGSPIVVSVESVTVTHQLLTAVVELCMQLGFRLAGIKGDSAEITQLTEELRLAHFPSGKATNAKSKANQIDQQKKAKAEPGGELKAPTKIVSTPVRSGQQVYSDGDLVVLAPVSAGAELLAVGCVHVYAPMRGRALAGVKGDESARIFCISQEAELVSIAGHFMIDQNLRDAHWQRAVQIFFDGNELTVEPLKGFAG